jgi:myo-inositol-1(or 4)-monophosphatase
MEMSAFDLQARREFGERLARIAGDFAASKSPNVSDLKVDMKGTQDWVTNADRETEELVRIMIREAFPGDNILGEEEGGSIDGVAWIVDPIDGTANFARGAPLWCVSIALVVDGSAQLGFVYLPILDEMYVTQRDEGAYLNGKKIQSRSTATPKTSMIELAWIRGNGFRLYRDEVAKLLEIGYEFNRLGTGAISLAWIACGNMEGYGEVDMNAWDGMAGWLLVRESGGAVNDYDIGCLKTKKAPIAVGANAEIMQDIQTSIDVVCPKLRQVA